MYIKNPKWLKNILSNSEIADTNYINEINIRLKQIVDNRDPEISIIIPARNEEQNILKCIDSLSRNTSEYSLEIIVVDNNSTDNTKDIAKQLDITVLDQSSTGIGISRQLGLEQAKGKYVLTADADCIYPSKYIGTMIDKLRDKKVICVTGRYCFIGNTTNKRWHFQFYEFIRDSLLMIRQWKHPYLNAWGGCMGFMREPALKIGYDYRDLRGEDGRLCFDLMSYGKIQFVSSINTKAWTYFPQDKSLFKELINKLLLGAFNLFWFFKRRKAHDTKTSSNNPVTFIEAINSLGKPKHR